MELYHEYTERLRNNAVAGILFKIVKKYFALIKKNRQRPKGQPNRPGHTNCYLFTSGMHPALAISLPLKPAYDLNMIYKRSTNDLHVIYK